MVKFRVLVSRNIKLFFKDKGMFFTSLVTPLILLVLYCTFLREVFKDSFMTIVSSGVAVKEELVDAAVAGQLVSSLLAVCCVTVAFCANFLMVQDKVNGISKDLSLTSVSKATMSFGYYVGTLLVTLIICFVALGVGLLYIYSCGWYLSATDVLHLALDVFLLVMFGTALSSFINLFLSSQGQISAVGTIISAGYGFICGAYMPMSQFSDGLQKALSLLPGTYATSLLRNHALQGTFKQMRGTGIPEAAVAEMEKIVDCQIEFFGADVSQSTMLLVLSGSVLFTVLLYVITSLYKNKN